MIEVVMCLCLGLAVALAAVVYLAVVLPRRFARLMLAEQAKGDARALAAKAALLAASSAEVAVIVQPLRALLEEQTRQALAARELATVAAASEVDRITGTLRALVEWLAAFANARYVQAVAETQAAPETKPSPERVPVSRERQSPRVPAIAPPGSVEPKPPEPAHRAAGLTRPAAPTQTPTAPVASGDGERRRGAVLGLAPAPAPRHALGSAPTLPSLSAVTLMERRSSSAVEGEGKPPSGGSAA
ncbi:MAG: hypothetical protein QM820_29735 [Minicystis sp.]